MTAAGWLQFAFVVVLLAISTPLLGRYMAKVYGEEKKAPGDRLFQEFQFTAERAAAIVRRLLAQRNAPGRGEGAT